MNSLSATPIPALFAQADADLPVITTGNVMAGIMVMAALGASFIMIGVWWFRFKEGQTIMPTASREPTVVPLPLAIVGVILTTMMALTVLLSGIESEAIPGPDNQAQEIVDAAVAEDSDAVEDNGAVEADDFPQENVDQEAKFREVLWQTMNINAIMFLGFGTFLWLARVAHRQQWRLANSAPDNDSTEMNLLASVSPVDDTNPYAILSSPTVLNTTEAEPWKLSSELRFATEAFLVAYLPTAVLRILIVSLLPDAPSHPFLEMLDDGADWNLMALIAVMAIVVAPLVEEMLYRVTILGGIWQHGSLPLAIVVSSVLFAAAHGFPDSIALLPLAFTIGYVYVRRRSYRTVILVHFLFNTFNMAIAGVSMI
ncbi:MAG: CPBP family intramembrane glutamic endopeptidase [Planctomycetaceae bacterium]